MLRPNIFCIAEMMINGEWYIVDQNVDLEVHTITLKHWTRHENVEIESFVHGSDTLFYHFYVPVEGAESYCLTVKVSEVQAYKWHDAHDIDVD